MRSFFLWFKGFPLIILISITKYKNNKPRAIIRHIIATAISVSILLKPAYAISKIKGIRKIERIRILIILGTFILLISQPIHSKNNSPINSKIASNITSILLSPTRHYILSGQSIFSISRIFLITVLTAIQRFNLACMISSGSPLTLHTE